jgi:glycosyltransferase involved in cell wall biosynthesis
LRIVKRSFPDIKTVVFGRAGIGHDDLANLRARPDLFIALTPTARDWAAQHAISPTKVVYLPNPIDPQPFTQAKPAKHELPRPILLVVGALTGYKNIPAVISAAAKLRQSLLLIGDGEESGAVNQLLSQYPAPFRWLKHLPPYDLPSYYLAADAFAFTPDPQEAFGRVYLEAMAAGLPIVASDDPIRRALVGKRGIYADPREQSSLVRSIRQALQRGKIDYSEELRPYLLSNVITSLEKELHALAD